MNCALKIIVTLWLVCRPRLRNFRFTAYNHLGCGSSKIVVWKKFRWHIQNVNLSSIFLNIKTFEVYKKQTPIVWTTISRVERHWYNEMVEILTTVQSRYIIVNILQNTCNRHQHSRSTRMSFIHNYSWCVRIKNMGTWVVFANSLSRFGWWPLRASIIS